MIWGARIESGLSLWRVIDEWVGDGQQRGQLDYYRRKAEQRTRMHRITERIGTASLCVGVGISVVLAVFACTSCRPTQRTT